MSHLIKIILIRQVSDPQVGGTYMTLLNTGMNQKKTCSHS
jgi:hypothetical protein